MAKPKVASALDANDILHTTSSNDSIIRSYAARHANRLGKIGKESNYTSELTSHRQTTARRLQDRKARQGRLHFRP